MRRRIEFPGAFYHVTQRGNNRERIFRKDKDKKCYLDNLVELRDKYQFQLYGYVLMDNHYHLLLRAGEEPLQKIMFRQNMYYSRYFNKTHRRSGHLYGDRYKASLIQDERYLFAVLRYIHLNPVKAGLCPTPAVYKWSSDNCYRSNRRGKVDIDFILNILSPDRNIAIQEYIRLMQIEDEVNYDSYKYIGDDTYKDKWEEKKVQEIRKPLDEILKETGVNADDFHLIKAGSRKRHLSSFKTAYIAEAVRQNYTYNEIGSNINISAAAVAKYHTFL